MEIADCYRLLGLRTGASYEDIKASYRRLARLYHPDANPTNPQQANEKFIQITEAYRKLTSIVPSSRPARTENPSTVTPISRNRSSAPSAATPASPQNNAQKQTPRTGPSVRITPDLTPTDLQLKQESYEQLQQLLREHRFPRAIALIEGLSQRLPKDVEVRQWQAITYQRFGRYLIGVNQLEKAKPYLRKALRTDPHNKSLGYEVDRDFRRIKEIAAVRKGDRLQSP